MYFASCINLSRHEIIMSFFTPDMHFTAQKFTENNSTCVIMVKFSPLINSVINHIEINHIRHIRNRLTADLKIRSTAQTLNSNINYHYCTYD